MISGLLGPRRLRLWGLQEMLFAHSLLPGAQTTMVAGQEGRLMTPERRHRLETFFEASFMNTIASFVAHTPVPREKV
ncbi:unnamed protein product [Protopolystoma xenopodis]|uniref:Uncharacterized protein n=1 Tax=Protopolystoma xenopodis TaxID=117903 RepID=A0A3S4ZQL9_9PLAT|nr:unnamed protein product [Protopolystoma xenopodis]